MDGQIHGLGGSVEYNGSIYYYSGTSWFARGNPVEVENSSYIFLNTFETYYLTENLENAAKDLLDEYFSNT